MHQSTAAETVASKASITTLRAERYIAGLDKTKSIRIATLLSDQTGKPARWFMEQHKQEDPEPCVEASGNVLCFSFTKEQVPVETYLDDLSDVELVLLYKRMHRDELVELVKAERHQLKAKGCAAVQELCKAVMKQRLE